MSEDITKGKKRKNKPGKVVYHLHVSEPPTGAHAMAEGHCEALQAKPDVDKSAADMAATGNPYENNYAAERSQSGRGRVAVNCPDLIQSNADFGSVLERLSTMRTARGNTVDLGLSPDTPGGFSQAGEVALRLFDAAQMAGSYRGMMPVNPDPYRPADHQSRGSGTPANGSNSYASQQAACSTSPMSAKASDRLATMKATMVRLG